MHYDKLGALIGLNTSAIACLPLFSTYLNDIVLKHIYRLEKGHLSPTSIAHDPINIKEKDEYQITKFPISRTKNQHTQHMNSWKRTGVLLRMWFLSWLEELLREKIIICCWGMICKLEIIL